MLWCGDQKVFQSGSSLSLLLLALSFSLCSLSVCGRSVLSHCTSVLLTFHFLATRHCRWKHCVFPAVHPSRLSVNSFVCSSGQNLPWYLMNGFSSLQETTSEYLLAHTDDLIRLWRSKAKGQGLKVTAGREGVEGIHVDASFSPSIQKYCDECVCTCACMYVCLSARISPEPHARSLSIFYACCL